MKSAVIYRTAVLATCCLLGAGSVAAWAEDLDSALESVNISTDAQSNPNKKNENAPSVPCSKTAGANCPTAHDDDVNNTAYQASTLQQSILSGSEANVTINGSPAINNQQGAVSISGF